jgi:hypothetical protein
MDITGKVIVINPLVNGEGKNGTWKKKEFVIETASDYPKKVCFSLWGDKIDKFVFNVGDELIVSFELESREGNGRWFTEARAWMIKTSSQNNQAPAADNNDPGAFEPEETDSLPF